MKKLFRKLHLWLSVPVGVIISIICLSGAILVFEQEITRAQKPQLYRVENITHCARLKPSELVARISRQIPDSLQLTALQYSGRHDETCQVSFTNSGRKTLSVNPYTGEVIGWIEGNRFFQQVRKLHRWLLDAPAQKGEQSFGKTIVGISTLLMVLILISGLVIWIPRSRKALKNRLTLSCNKGWRRFVHDSHVALGFYATLFLLVMALTGLTWSFGWYRNAAYSLFGANTQTTAVTGQNKNRQEPAEQQTKQEKPAFNYAVWDNALAELQMHYPQYKSIKLNMDNAQIAPDPESAVRRTDTAKFDPENGKIRHIQYYQDLPKSQTLRGWFYAFHTGSWGGIWTKILYFIAAMTGGTLPISGYYLWIKRIRKKQE